MTVQGQAGMYPVTVSPQGAVGITGPVQVYNNAQGQPLGVTGPIQANQGLPNTQANAWPIEISDGTHGPVAVKPANSPAVAADPALVVTISPDSAYLGMTGPIQANQGTPNTQANAWPIEISDGTHGPVAVKPANTPAAVTDAALVVTMSPDSAYLGVTGPIQVTQPNAASLFATVVGEGIAGTPTGGILSAQTPDTTATGALGALNAAVQVSLSGSRSVGFQLAAGTLIGTIVPEVSFDGGTTWSSTFFDNSATSSKVSSIAFSASNAATASTIVGVGGSGLARIRVSAYTSGTANITIRASQMEDPSVLFAGPTGAAAPPPTAVQLGGITPTGTYSAIVASAEGALGHAVMMNECIVQSDATITTSGSQIVARNFYGVQQISLIVNVKAAPTGTTPTLTYTIQEIDPGDGATTMGNSTSTTAIAAAGVYVATLATSTSGLVKISWVITGTTPSFTQVYATVVSKVTPALQQTTTTVTAAISGNAPGYVTTAAKTNVVLSATAYTEQTANFTGSIVSSSANDTSAGTGARTVTITWVDQTGATTGTETVTLNGATAVNLVTTTKCFIEKITVATVGSGGSNAGTITLFAGTAGTGTNVASIAIGDNRTYLGHHYVVSGKTCNITGMTGLNNSSNNGIFTLLAQVLPAGANVNVQVSDWITGSQTNQIVRLYDQLLKVPGPARIQMWVFPQGSPTTLSQGSFDYYDQ